MTTDDHSFKSRADIVSNICSFFIVLQATKLRRKTIEKLYAADKKNSTNRSVTSSESQIVSNFASNI